MLVVGGLVTVSVGCVEESRDDESATSAAPAGGSETRGEGSTSEDEPGGSGDEESGSTGEFETESGLADEAWHCAVSGEMCGCTEGYEFFSGEPVDSCEGWGCCWTSTDGKCACRDVGDLLSCEEFVDGLTFDATVTEACGYEPDASGEDESGDSNGGGSTDECSYDSQCSSGKICRYGSCESVECTSDSHCGGCTRCSGNSCVSCGEGPYGCYC